MRPGEMDVSKLEILHGWRSVNPESKKEILMIGELRVCTDGVVVVTENEFSYEYEGFGDEFFVQDNS